MIEYIRLIKSINNVTLKVASNAVKSFSSSKNSIKSLSEEVIIIAKAAKNKEKMIDKTVIPILKNEMQNPILSIVGRKIADVKVKIIDTTKSQLNTMVLSLIILFYLLFLVVFQLKSLRHQLLYLSLSE